MGPPEHASPLLIKLWLSHVREARPIYLHDFQTVLSVCSLPVIGLIGYLAMFWRSRRDTDRLVVWLAVAHAFAGRHSV